MSDIKLFHINNNKVTELEGKSVTIEKSLQTLIEAHLETFLGIKFLAYNEIPACYKYNCSICKCRYIKKQNSKKAFLKTLQTLGITEPAI